MDLLFRVFYDLIHIKNYQGRDILCSASQCHLLIKCLYKSISSAPVSEDLTQEREQDMWNDSAHTHWAPDTIAFWNFSCQGSLNPTGSLHAVLIFTNFHDTTDNSPQENGFGNQEDGVVRSKTLAGYSGSPQATI